MADLESSLKEMMTELFGNCSSRNGVLRSLIEHLGAVDSSVILEVLEEPGLHEEAPYPILHFFCTIAQNVNEKDVPQIVLDLNELNTCINVGAFPAFGCFGYYAPLQQIYLSYRMPFNTDKMDEELKNAEYYLGSLYEQLDVFCDFILFVCDHPYDLTLQTYLDYLDSIADLADLTERVDKFEELLKDTEESFRRKMKAEGMTDEELDKLKEQGEKEAERFFKEAGEEETDSASRKVIKKQKKSKKNEG